MNNIDHAQRFIEPVTLEGRLVRLEPLLLAHVPQLAAVGCDEAIWALMLYGQIRNEGDMRRWVEALLKKQRNGTDMPFTVIERQTQMAVGATRYLEMRPAHRSLSSGAPMKKAGIAGLFHCIVGSCYQIVGSSGPVSLR